MEMNRYALLFATMAAIFVGGCASTDAKKTADQQSADSQDDTKYTVTGSRIPRKDKNAASVKSMDNQDAQDALRNTAPLIVPPAGGAR
jgi:hypothetical protein